MAPSAARIERLSIISIAPGDDPAETISETTSPACTVEPKNATSVRTDSGFGTTRSQIRGGDAERALGAHEGAHQVVARVVELLAAERDLVPSGSTSSSPVT